MVMTTALLSGMMEVKFQKLFAKFKPLEIMPLKSWSKWNQMMLTLMSSYMGRMEGILMMMMYRQCYDVLTGFHLVLRMGVGVTWIVITLSVIHRASWFLHVFQSYLSYKSVYNINTIVRNAYLPIVRTFMRKQQNFHFYKNGGRGHLNCHNSVSYTQSKLVYTANECW